MGDKIQITKHENFRVLSGVSESTIVVATNYKIQTKITNFQFCHVTKHIVGDIFLHEFCLVAKRDKTHASLLHYNKH